MKIFREKATKEDAKKAESRIRKIRKEFPKHWEKVKGDLAEEFPKESEFYLRQIAWNRFVNTIK